MTRTCHYQSPTAKKIFRTELDAKISLWRIASSKNREKFKMPTRSYPCSPPGEAKHYHLTSTPIR